VKARKRCRCRDADGRDLGDRCPKLKRRDGTWNPNHGTWFARKELTPAPDGGRVELKAGGFATEDELDEWFDDSLALLKIPEKGPRGHEARMQILDLIKEAKKKSEDLPDYDDLRQRYRQGAALKSGLLGPYLDQWLVGKKRELRPSAYATVESHVRVHLKRHLGRIEIGKLRVADVNDMLTAIAERNERIDEGLERGRSTGPVMQERIVDTLRNALEDAIPEGIITFNPAKYAKLPPAKKTKPLIWTEPRFEAFNELYQKALAAERAHHPGRHVDPFKVWRRSSLRPSKVMIWTPEQTGKFLDRAMQDRLYALYHLVAFRGLRRGEACGAELPDLDLKGAELAVHTNRVVVGWEIAEGDVKTEASDAPVSLDKATVITLTAYLEQQAKEREEWGEAWIDSGKIFTKENGEALHPAWVTTSFLHIAFEAGLPPIRLHDLRHGAATLARLAGIDTKLISEMLRHSTTRITDDLYGAIPLEVSREAAEKIAAMVPRETKHGASKQDRAPSAPPSQELKKLTRSK
jgi:integrase